jgi:TPR repeat protein
VNAPPEPGHCLGSYRLLDRLGQGGMGVVYRAMHVDTGAEYALKVLLPGADTEARLRFGREGEAQARVDVHPNVVRIHSAGVEGDSPFLVMDLAQGGDLDQRLRHGLPDPSESVAQLASLARGLAHVHACGILHRDLKPTNVLFDAAGVPKLVDFGLARLADAKTLTQTGTLLGTPAYMAPEQVRGEVLDERTDVYGLGGVLYYALTGSPPFAGSSVLVTLNNVLEEHPVPPRTLRPEITRSIEAVCLRALAKAPADRFPSALAFAEALEGGDPRSTPSRNLVAGVAAVGLLAGLVLVLSDFSGTPVKDTPVAEVQAPTGTSAVAEVQAPTATSATLSVELPPDLLRAVERGEGWALLKGAQRLLQDGREGEDWAQSERWLGEAREAGETRAAWALGQLAEPRKDLPGAAALYAEGVELDDARAMVGRGRLLQRGLGVKKDVRAALELFGRAAEKKEPSAWRELGLCALKGVGLEQDNFIAHSYLTRAKEAGDPKAGYHLAGLHREGRVPDAAKAVALDQEAAAAGDVGSMVYTGSRLLTSDSPEKHKEGLALLMRAAKTGSAFAYAVLARSYLTGQGVERDVKEARAWCELGAEAGDAHAMIRLSLLLENETHGETAAAQAEEWRRRAEKTRNVTNMAGIGSMYARGTPPLRQPDFEEAARWLRRAVEGGHTPSMVQLAGLLSRPERRPGPPRDLDEAERVYRLAASKGSTVAAKRLERLIQSGRWRRHVQRRDPGESPPDPAD